MTETLLKEHPLYRPLELADRCDRCGDCSQAFVRGVKEINGTQHDLLFCGHHFNKYQAKLLVDGWLIQDERNTINSKPMSGAPEGALTSGE